jgi:rod shape determining protein RodA
VREQRGIFKNIDWVMFILYLVLVFIGWLNIYSAVYNENHQSIADFSQRYGKQLIWIAAAFFLAMLTLLIEGKFYSQFAYLFYGITLLLLVAVLFMGKTISGSKSWFQIGGIALQPGEFAKIGTALAISKYLSNIEIDLRKPRNLIIVSVIILFPALLILLEDDTGSAIVFVSFVAVLYRAGMSGKLMSILVVLPLLAVLALVMNKFIIIAILLGAAVIYYLYSQRRIQTLLAVSVIYLFSVGLVFSVDFAFNHVLEPHQKVRIEVLLGKDSDLKGAGYNVNQSLIAIGSGGIFGKGYLQGTQTKYNFVPEQSTDFIFCTVGEEWGFLGSITVMGLFIWLLIRIILVAERQRSRFSRIYGYGVASIIFFHFVINVGMTLGLMPVIGIPLPFFSYGGSSLWAFTILLFIFIRQDSYRYELL